MSVTAETQPEEVAASGRWEFDESTPDDASPTG